MILIALGSNLNSETFGTPLENCLKAIEFIKKEYKILNVSNFYETEPIPKTDQPFFVNAVISVETKDKPNNILKNLMLIEKKFKRIRKKKNESRSIDLDLLSYNNEIKSSPDLILPHPRMHLRKFVMMPICDIDENWVHPLLKKKARKIVKELANQKISNIKLSYGKSYD